MAGKYELLLDDAATPLDTFTNGYKDLESKFGPYIPTIFTYDGKHYKKGYNFSLNQIIIPSNLNEVKKMILNESKKRLIRAKNTYFKNDNDSWYEKGILDDPSYEDNWKEKMNRNYSEIKIEAFKVSNRGISFYYDTTLGFAMAILSEEASPEYFYSWAVLKPYLMPSSPISSLVK